MSRILRRIIVRYFGGTRNFVIWTAALVVTIWVLDTYLLSDNRQHGNLQKSKLDHQQRHPIPYGTSVRAMATVSSVQQEQVAKCGHKVPCPPGQYAYLIRSGQGIKILPTICFEDHYALHGEEKAADVRGLHVAVLNVTSLKITELKRFDTYQEDTMLVRFLKLHVPDNFIILGASADEITNSLHEDALNWMRRYGTDKISKVKFRDSYAFIGQRGLEANKALERVYPKSNKEFADPAEISGCMSIPMGKVSKIDVKRAQIEDQLTMKFGETLPNCGYKHECEPNSFPAHLSSGEGKDKGPTICIKDQYVLSNKVNEGGRGMNVAVVNPKNKEVKKVARFDTYADDSSQLEIFLESLIDGDIIMVVTHDDASKKLSDHVKQLFNDLGSGVIQNLKFRDVWVFVGQKGIDGFGDLEQIEYAGPGGQWPRPIDLRLCIPTKLRGSKIRPDPVATKNEKRRAFCSKYDGYGEFCDSAHIDESLTPAPLTDRTMEKHAIFSVPIVVIPGLNHNALRTSLETLMMQAGLHPHTVMVMFDPKFPEAGELAIVFGFQAVELESSTKYISQMEKAIAKGWEKFPDEQYLIVLEEELILAPDFLSYMGQVLPAIEKDKSLIGISAWNDNGYSGLSTDATLTYRVEMFPGLGFLMKRSFYEHYIRGNTNACCSRRAWEGWMTEKMVGKEMIIPDVSRVFRRPYEGVAKNADFLKELFNRQRTTNLDSKAKLKNVELLGQSKYEEDVESYIEHAVEMDTRHSYDCLAGKGFGFYLADEHGRNYKVYFNQTKLDDHSVLTKINKCFGLFSSTGHQARGLHKGVLRFTYKGNNMIFIGTATEYSKKYKPKYPAVGSVPEKSLPR